MIPKIRFTAGWTVLFLALMANPGWAGPVAQENGPKPLPSAVSGEASKDAPIMDPRALSTLKQMSETLDAAKTVSFNSKSMVPIKGPQGMWIDLFESSRVVKQGTEKLYAETRGDFFPYDFYFNGKTITAYAPTKNVYAEKAAPGTIDDLIERAYREDGKSFPYADILIANPYEVLTGDLVSAVFVGQSTIQGVKADHLLFSNKGVTWQIWIGAADHLPRLVTAAYFNDPREPNYTVEFFDWKLNEPVPENTFIFSNASQAAKVDFRNPK